MKKLIGLLFLLIIIPSCIFALSVCMKYDNGAASGVDLSNDSIISNSYPCTGQHDSTSPEISYSNDQILARIEIDPSNDLGRTIEISFPDLNYMYGNSRRPYGVELVYKTEYSLDMPLQTEDTGLVISEYKALGHNSVNDSSASITVINPDTLSSLGEDVLKAQLPFLYSIFEYLYYNGLLHWIYQKEWNSPYEMLISLSGNDGLTLKQAYIDVVLVLPELTFDEDRQMVYTGTDTNDPNPRYESTMEVNDGEYKFYGYYPKKYNMLDFNLTVTPTGATSINLSVPDVQPEAAGVEIAEYECYATFYGDAERETAFYAFLSSSQDPTADGGEFALQGGSSNIIYQAGISNGSTKKWFNGYDTVNLGQNVSNNIDSLFDGSSSYVAIDNNRKQYSDRGEILFRLAPKHGYENVYSIPPGTYTSNIYFHVVANL